MKFLKQLFAKHPELRTQYVDASITALNYLAKPIDLFMQHLLVVQEIDPQTKPGERYQKALAESLNKTHEKDFDDNYDFSWIRKSFNKTQKGLPNLNMTPAQYHRATDIGSLQSPTAPKDEFFNRPSDLSPSVLAPTIVDDLLTKEGRERRREQAVKSAQEYFQKAVDKSRAAANDEHKEVQLEKKDPSEFKQIVSLIKEYNAERDAEKVFKQMVHEAEAKQDLEERVQVPLASTLNLKEALQTIVKLAQTVEGTSPLDQPIKHRDGNSLIRKDVVEKGFIKRYRK